MPIKNCIIVGLAASAEAFTVGMPATSRPQAVVSRCSVAPEMGLGTFFKKLIGKKESPEVTNFRSQLAGMDSLSGLSELSLEQPEGREVCPYSQHSNTCSSQAALSISQHSLRCYGASCALIPCVSHALDFITPLLLCRRRVGKRATGRSTSSRMDASGITTLRRRKCSGRCQRSLRSWMPSPPLPPPRTRPAARRRRERARLTVSIAVS